MRKSIYKRIFAFSLTAAMALTSVFSGSAPASAKKAPKLSSKKLSIAVGKTKKLTVKNAKKKVKWSTSNKKVAKVSKTSGKKKSVAVIKGVKKGTAKITAKVGKKKLTCKVTVKKATTNIKSVSVDQLDNSCLIVTLKKKAAINLSDIKLLTKTFNAGKYNSQATVKSITTADQTVYRLYTNVNINSGRFVKLSIGKDVYESQNKPNFIADTSLTQEDLTEIMKKGEVYKEYCSGYFLNAVGSCKYAVKEGALPAGLVLDARKGLIKGIPTTVGGSTATIEATDEMGRKATVSLNFVVYDENTIAAKPVIRQVRLDDYVDKRLADTANNTLGKTFYQSFYVEPKGGSGTYNFSLAASDTAGTALSTDPAEGQTTPTAAESTRLKIPFAITEGTHVFTIHVTDAKNPAIVADVPVTLNVVRFFDVNGTVTEANGKQVMGNRIFFIPAGAVQFNQYIEGVYSAKRVDIKDYNTEKNYREDYEFDSYVSDENYYVGGYNCTAYAGASSTETVPGRAVGTYATELAAGEYIVKIYSEADDTLYETNSHITIGAADAPGQNLVLPTRLYSVIGTATYANGNPIADTTIYFEAVDNQFEGYASETSGFRVKTSATGAFIASLPSNTYAAYILDKANDQRLYFTTNIEVKDADVTLTSFALGVSRSVVSGTVMIDNKPLVQGKKIYFFTSDTNTNTSDAAYTEILDEKGSYSITLADGTYYVKYSVSDSYYDEVKWRSLGVVTVAGQNVTQNLSYSILSEIGTPVQVVSSGSAISIASTGTYAQVEIPKSGNYELKVETKNETLNRVQYYIYDDKLNQKENGNIYLYSDYSDENKKDGSSDVYFSAAGTYYIKLTPRDNQGDAIPSADITFSYDKDSYSYSYYDD